MCKKIFFIASALLVLTLLVIHLSAQQQGKPNIRVTILPSVPIPKGPCTTSYIGYMEKDGRTNLTNEEIGSIVSENLKLGYVVILYPKTSRGIFMDIECNAAAEPKISAK